MLNEISLFCEEKKPARDWKPEVVAGSKNVTLNSFQHLFCKRFRNKFGMAKPDTMSVSEGWKAKRARKRKCSPSQLSRAKISLVLLFFTFFFLNFPVFSEEIKFKADSMTGVSGSKTDETKLMGNAFVKTSTMEIKADSITLDGEDFRYITAEGNVEGKNTETKMDFTCGKLRYDRNTKLARLEDTVHMIDIENEVTTDAQIIEYNQDKEIATMQIGVTLKQKNNTCTAAFAIYRKGAQMLEMSGNPKIVQGEDTFRAQEIILNLDSQEITLSGRVSGSVTDSKKEKEVSSEQGAGSSSDGGETSAEQGKSPDGASDSGEEKPTLPSVTDILNSDTNETENGKLKEENSEGKDASAEQGGEDE